MKVSGSVILYAAAALALGGLAYVVIRKGSDLADAAPAAIGKAVDAITPTNPENIFARGSNAVAQTISGDSTVTFGSWIYDLIHPGANDAVAPTPIKAPAPNMATPTGEGITMDEFMANVPTRPGQLPVDGSGGAAFGLYPNPFRSK